MRLRSWFAKAGMLLTVVSKSKSKPSMTDVPKGRGTSLPDTCGPKIDHKLFAAATASAEVENPLSVYVDPPIESRIVVP
jgi:hypothetical protein